jgi:hypothetical protein
MGEVILKMRPIAYWPLDDVDGKPRMFWTDANGEVHEEKVGGE